MCKFGVGGARRRPHRAPSLTDSTSDCAVLLRSRRTKRSGIIREMSLLCACRKERSDGIAIATKSIASRVPRSAVAVGSLKHCADGERRLGKHMRKGENSILGLFGEPVMIFNKNINQTYDKSEIKSGVKKIFQKN